MSDTSADRRRHCGGIGGRGGAFWGTERISSTVMPRPPLSNMETIGAGPEAPGAVDLGVGEHRFKDGSLDQPLKPVPRRTISSVVRLPFGTGHVSRPHRA
jgi:hypothetical protein